MKRSNIDLIKAVPVDMSTSFDIEALWLADVVNYSIQLVFSGSPIGVWKLQASNDETRLIDGVQHSPNPVNWTDIVGSSQPISASGTHIWNVANEGYLWVRVVYTATSGTGSLDSARTFIKAV